jgi:hypothetical protein
MAEFKPITTAEFAKKKRRPNTSFRAESAKYEARTGRILVQLTNGIATAFPVASIKGLETATPEDLRRIEVQGKGYGLYLPLIDADISVSRLFSDLLGSNVMAQAERRTLASRSNGQKGGRPKASDRATA